jgi:methylated-DNA-[protein]-cysteine S-methyltransferase
MGKELLFHQGLGPFAEFPGYTSLGRDRACGTGFIETGSEPPVAGPSGARMKRMNAPTLAESMIETPIGRLGLLATERGLVKVALATEPFELVADQVATLLGARPTDQPNRLDDTKRQLNQYFEKNRRVFDLRLDLSLVKGFTRRVVRQIEAIAYAHTVSYGEIAAALGRPGAARAVGRACGANPLPVVIPCHRVIRADGSLGGFGGGLDVKRTLLRLERGSAPC